MIILADNVKRWKLVEDIQSDGFHNIITGPIYPYSRSNQRVERNNFIFEASLKYESFSRGRSSVAFQFIDIDEPRHFLYGGSQTMAQIVKFLQEGKLAVDPRGGIKGKFTFVKQGSEVYVMPYGEE